MSDARRPGHREMTVRRYASAADADRDDLAYWRSLPPGDRVLMAWRLSEEQWRLRGEWDDEPGLVDLLRALIAADVRFLVVGAYALAVHGRPRATGDLDIWVEATADNAARVMRALSAFGAPTADIQEQDFAAPGIVYQLGVAPRRIDLLTRLDGVAFDEAWPERVRAPFGDLDVDFIGLRAFVKNKRAVGRLRDLADIEGLE